MAEHYKNEPAVWVYDLINEPLRDSAWPIHAQGAIDAIRTVDRAKAIIAMPQHEGASEWNPVFPGYWGPAGNLWYEAHVYFDRGSAGLYGGTYGQEGAYPTIGIDRSASFVSWCKLHQARCTMGEYSIPWRSHRRQDHL